MRNAQPFHSSETPIESGFTVIEASAGTGKTYTIALLVVRLILERALPIERILISTYTELATAELRERIRSRLAEALAHFEQQKPVDETLAAICAKFQNESQVRDATRLLRDAVENFDRAAIYTIHGFCQRMLSECAFESGSLFDAEVLKDERTVSGEVVGDFWRTHFYTAAPIFSQLADVQGVNHGDLSSLLAKRMNNPTIEVETDDDVPPFDLLKNEISALWTKLESTWKSDEQTIRSYFSENGNDWAKKNTDAGKPQKMANFFDQLSAAFSEFGKIPALEKIAPSALQKATLQNAITPSHPFFEMCEKWISLTAIFGKTLRLEFWRWAANALQQRKQRRNVIAFSDMLVRLRDALTASDGDAFAKLLRERFCAALIDEFQDTDPIQYEIFRRIYHDSDAPVFLIGDPKQAIYKFRGADVYTYLKALREADRIYTLETNWRSSGELVVGVNTLFGSCERPFVVSEIAYRAVCAAGLADERPLTTDGEREARPLKLQLLLNAKDHPTKSIDQQLGEMVVSEIGKLLGGGVKIGDDPLKPKDFAVLVETNRQAQQIQKTLSQARIPSVLYSAKSVFATREATELQRVLMAVGEPQRESFLKAALVTEMLGSQPAELVAMESDLNVWEKVCEEFQRDHELWQKFGFVPMFRRLLRDRKVRQQLLRFPDGERRLTNLLHLGELLQLAQTENALVPDALIAWLSTQRQGADGFLKMEEHQLRLESDEDAVRVITVHKSKGLEYGIVLCPFVWQEPRRERGYIEFHDADGQLKLAIDEPTKEEEELANREQLADQMRRFYVAVTRAKYRCDLFWGDFPKGAQSGLSYLLGTNGDEAALRARAEISAEQIRAEAMAVSERNPALEIYEPQIDEKPEPLHLSASTADLKFHAFHGAIDSMQGVTSFTTLTRHAEEAKSDLGEQNEDISLEPPQIEIPLEGMAAFPRGATPGVALHQIFEQINFSDLSVMPMVVSERLRSFGIRGFEMTVSEMIKRVVRSPLANGVQLSRVAPRHRLTELEFHFPISKLDAQRLAQFFANGEVGGEWAERLNFRTVRGFMKGFVDLVFEQDGKFYIVDWKSNWLGASILQYSEQAMRDEMTKQLYWLQLHLYVVALHRYLKLRLRDYDYDAHFGGVFYIFLRGVDDALPEHGVMRHRPTRETIEKLDELLGGRDGG